MDQLRGKPLQGEWWEPGHPSDVYKGILRIEENNHGTLTFKGSEKKLLKFVRPGTGTIFGRLTSRARSDLTLFDVGMTTSPSGFTDYNERETDVEFFTNIILVGAHIESRNACIVSAALLRATGLGEWCDSTGFSGQADVDRATHRTERVDVSYSASASAFYPIGPGKSLRLVSQYSGPMFFTGQKHVTMSEEDLIELRFEKDVSLDDILHETSIWQNFLTFALRKSSYMSELQLSLRSAAVPQFDWSLLVPGRRVDDRLNRRGVTEILFTRSRFEDRLGEYLHQWRQHYEAIEIPILLFTGTAYDGSDFTHARLLTYLQALEIFHRNLFGGSRFPDKRTRKDTLDALRAAIPTALNGTLRQGIGQQLAFVGELTLFDRLKDLFSRYAKSLDSLFPDGDADMGLLRDVRNFLTHFGSRRDFDKDFLWSRELMALSDRTKLFMEICLLGVLGMDDEGIYEMIRQFEPYVNASYERRHYPPQPSAP